MQNTKGKEFSGSLAELIAKVEDHDSLGSFPASVPGRQSPEPARDEAGLGNTKQQASADEGGIICLESLESADGTKEEQL